MIQTDLGNSGPTLIPGVFPGPIPLSVYSPTSMASGTGGSFVIIGTHSGGFSDRLPGDDLRAFYDRTGLTWKEIAGLFGVSERAIHAWVCAEKKMRAERADFLAGLMELAMLVDQGRPYRTRKFLRENLLNNKGLVSFLKKQDIASVVAWARLQTRAKSIGHRPVSDVVLREKLPPDLVSMLSAGDTEVRIIGKGKARAARVARVRKKNL